MRKVINSLPSVKWTIVTLVVCLALGVIVAGFHPKALVSLVIGVLVLAMVTARNYDPVSWEMFNEPRTHSMRCQRDEMAERLRAVVTAFDKDDKTALVLEMSGARQLLAETYPSTPVR